MMQGQPERNEPQDGTELGGIPGSAAEPAAERQPWHQRWWAAAICLLIPLIFWYGIYVIVARLNWKQRGATIGTVAGVYGTVFLVALVTGLLQRDKELEQLYSSFEDAYASQAQEQARIDNQFPQCSDAWVRATARSYAEQTTAVVETFGVSVDDVVALGEDIRDSLKRFCDDGDIESYCRSSAEAFISRARGDLAAIGGVEDFKAGCLVRNQLEVSSSMAIGNGDCVVFSVSSAAEVSCVEPHDAKAVDVWEIPDSDLPDDSAIDSYFQEQCPLEAESFLYPTQTTWSAGDRSIICLDEDQ